MLHDDDGIAVNTEDSSATSCGTPGLVAWELVPYRFSSLDDLLNGELQVIAAINEALVEGREFEYLHRPSNHLRILDLWAARLGNRE